MLSRSPSSPETKADKIVKVAIWKPLDIQIDRRALNLQFRAADDVDFAITNREGFYGVVILLALASQLL
jgi:hypothetical protein